MYYFHGFYGRSQITYFKKSPLFSACPLGHLSLENTGKCKSNGYVCSIGDQDSCCKRKEVEARSCIPCDETRHKKPKGTEYVSFGNCDYRRPNGELIV